MVDFEAICTTFKLMYESFNKTTQLCIVFVYLQSWLLEPFGDTKSLVFLTAIFYDIVYSLLLLVVRNFLTYSLWKVHMVLTLQLWFLEYALMNSSVTANYSDLLPTVVLKLLMSFFLVNLFQSHLILVLIILFCILLWMLLTNNHQKVWSV
jgi:hypothetical protein